MMHVTFGCGGAEPISEDDPQCADRGVSGSFCCCNFRQSFAPEARGSLSLPSRNDADAPAQIVHPAVAAVPTKRVRLRRWVAEPRLRVLVQLRRLLRHAALIIHGCILPLFLCDRRRLLPRRRGMMLHPAVTDCAYQGLATSGHVTISMRCVRDAAAGEGAAPPHAHTCCAQRLDPPKMADRAPPEIPQWSMAVSDARDRRRLFARALCATTRGGTQLRTRFLLAHDIRMRPSEKSQRRNLLTLDEFERVCRVAQQHRLLWRSVRRCTRRSNPLTVARRFFRDAVTTTCRACYRHDAAVKKCKASRRCGSHNGVPRLDHRRVTDGSHAVSGRCLLFTAEAGAAWAS